MKVGALRLEASSPLPTVSNRGTSPEWLSGFARPAMLYYYIEKSIIFAKIFRLRVP